MKRTYINCGTSHEAVRVAMATYAAVDMSARLSEATVRTIHGSQDDGNPMSIAYDHGGTMTYSRTSYFKENDSWKEIGDFSGMKPVFKVVEIRLNPNYLAKLHEDHVTVNTCNEKFPNENILRVADQIRKNETEHRGH